MAKFLKTYEILFKKSKVDLNMAKIALNAFEKDEIELDIEAIMFHLQQSAEKLFKTILDINHIKFPHSHDLEKLYNLIKENDIMLIDKSEELLPLSEYAVEGRYAIIHDDLDDADKYIDILDELVEFVKGKIL